ncbi:MAG: hypothetical protein QOI15_888 [Pseudonocardiales bacterium]|nr:hypothetical protein [Pseudonocardiales bacterium]
MDEQPAGDERAPRPLVVACGVLALQALALVAAAAIVLVKAATQKSTTLPGAVLLAAIALGGAAALVVCARGLLRLRPAARTPAVVIELLALPVSYSLAIQAGRVAYGAPIMLSALAVIYLLFTPPARAVLDRDLDA